MKRVFLLAGALVAFTACTDEQASQGNRPPELTVPGPQVVVEGQLLAFVVGTTDPDDDPVVVTTTGLPENAAFNAQSGQVLWTPDFRQSGSYSVGFSATDQRFTVEARVDVTVVDANRPPALDGLSDVTVDEGAQVALLLAASDPDGDPVTVSAAPLPEDSSFDPESGLFTWDVGYDQAGVHVVVVTAAEQGAAGLTVKLPVQITVEDVNRRPVFGAPLELVAREKELIDFVVPVSDPDGDALDVVVPLGADQKPLLPPGDAAFVPSSRHFTWTPQIGDAAVYNVNFVATDLHLPPESALSTVGTLVIRVVKANRAPTLDRVEDMAISEATTLLVTLSGHDADSDPLTYAVYGLAGAEVAGNVVTWTADCNAAGAYTVLFTATDTSSESASRTAKVIVNPANCAPRLSAIDVPPFALEGLPMIVQVTATDPDVPTVFDFDRSGAPGSIMDRATGLFTWTPRFDQGGDGSSDYPVVFTVTDDGAPALGDARTEVITVLDDNRAPTFDPLAALTVRERDPAQVTVTAHDLDGDAITDLTVTATPLFDRNGAAAALIPVSAAPGLRQAQLLWTPTCKDGGAGAEQDYQVTFRAVDAKGKPGVATMTLRVTNLDCAPDIRVVPATDTTTELGTITLAVTASDPDGAGLALFTATGGPLAQSYPSDPIVHHRAVFQPVGANAGGTLTWTTGCGDAVPGVYTVTFTAQDLPTGRITTRDAVLRVTPTNCPPSLAVSPNLDTMSVAENASLSFTVTATDPEGSVPSLSLSTAAPPNPPRRATLTVTAAAGTSRTVRFDWTPDCLQSGDYPLTFTSANTGGASLSKTVTVTVTNINCRPTLTSIVPWTTPLDGERPITLRGTDLVAGTSLLVDGQTEPLSENTDPTVIRFRPPPRSAPAVALVQVDNHQNTDGPSAPLKLHYYDLRPLGGIDWGRTRAIAASSRDPALFAVLESVLLYVSTDGGASWLRRGPQPLAAPPPPPAVQPRELLAFDALSDTTLYFAGASTGFEVHRSLNQGRSWSRLAQPAGVPLPSPGGCAIPGGQGPTAPYSGMAPAPGAGVYLLTKSGCAAGVWRSPQGAQGWLWLHGDGSTALPDPSLSPAYLALASAPSNRSTLFVVTDQGTYRSTSGGAGWTAGAPVPGTALALRAAFDPADDRHLFVLTDAGVEESLDLGGSWTHRGAFSVVPEGDLAVGAGGGAATVYVATPFGLESSTDNGVSVASRSVTPTMAKFVAAPQTPAGGLRGVVGFLPPAIPGEFKNSVWVRALASAALRTEDGGQSWQDASTDLSGAGVEDLVITRSGAVVALSGRQVYRRAAGSTGRFAPAAVQPDFLTDLAASESGSETVFALRALDPGPADWIYRSTDAGMTFLDKTPVTGRQARTMAVTPGALHVVTDGGGKRWMMRSTSDGDGWTEFPQGLLGYQADALHSSGRLFVDHQNTDYFWYLQPITYGGNYGSNFRRSTNYGATWIHDDPAGLGLGYSALFIERNFPTGPTTRLLLAHGLGSGSCCFSSLYRNTLSGDSTNWAPVSWPVDPGDPSFRPVGAWAELPAQGVFLGGTSAGFLVTTNRGQSWRKMYVNEIPVGMSISSIQPDRRANTVIFSTRQLEFFYPPVYGAGVYELEIVLP